VLFRSVETKIWFQLFFLLWHGHVCCSDDEKEVLCNQSIVWLGKNPKTD